MVPNQQQASDSDEVYIDDGTSALFEVDVDPSTADTNVIAAAAEKAAEKCRQLLEVNHYADGKIRITVLRDELTPHMTILRNTDPKTKKIVTAEQNFLRGAAEIYIQKFGRFATLRAFTLFLQKAIRTSVNQEDQEEYSKVCFTILAEFAGKNFAHQSEDYLKANEEERSAIISSTSRTISEVITYLLNPENETDTTRPSSEALPQN